MKVRWIDIPVMWLIAFCGGQAFAENSLATKSGCFECHSVDKNVIGPSFQNIAQRYKNVDGAREMLIEKVANGGKGNWTEISREVPMPPHAGRLSEAEIASLVDWILGL